MPLRETDESIHTSHREIPPHIVADFADYMHDGLADRTTDKIWQVIFQRNGTKTNPNGTKIKRTEQSLGIYDLLGQTSNAAEGDYADNLRGEIKKTIKDKTGLMTHEERQRATMVLPSLVGALLLNEKFVDKAYAKSLPASVEVALDWFINPDIVDQTHIRVGFGGEEVTNSRAPAYIIPALETQRRVRDTFTRYGNWAIHHEMVERIKESTSQTPDHQRDVIAQANAAIADRLAALDPGQNKKTPSELMEEIYNITSDHGIPGQIKRSVLLDTWQDVFGEPLDVEQLERKYHFTNKVPKLVIFNAANAAIEVDGMDRERVTGARDTTQALLQKFAESFYPEMGDSIMFQNDKPWDNHDYYTQMMVMFSRYLTSKRSNIGGVWKNLDRFGAHHQRANKNARVIDGMSPAETYGSLHAFFFQDPLETRNPSELLPDPGIMEPVDNPRHVIFHQGPPEIQFGALRKVWAQDAGAKAFVDWMKWRRDYADVLQSTAQEILNESQVLDPSEFGSQARRKINSAHKKVQSLLVGMIESVEHDPDPIGAWERQMAEIRLFDSEFSTPLIDGLNALRTEIGKRNDAIQVAVARNDGSFGQLISDEIGQNVIRQTRNAVELTVSVGTIPVYYPLKGVDREVDAQSPNPTLADYEDYLAQTTSKTKRMKGTMVYVSDKLLPESEQLADADAQPQAPVDEPSTIAAIKALYDEVEAHEQVIADEGRSATEDELAQMTAFLQESVAIISEQSCSSTRQIFQQAHSEILRDRAVAESKAQAVMHDFKLLLQAIDADPHVAEQKYGELLDRIKQGMAAHVQEQVVAYL
ncbi:MAG: hypothetical protein WBO77_02490 [Microgenomates group bacterium]